MTRISMHSDTKLKLLAFGLTAATMYSTMWICAQGFGENYDVEPDDITKQAIARYSAQVHNASIDTVHDTKDIDFVLTDAYINDVLAGERPHTVAEIPNVCENIFVTPRKRYELTAEERAEIERVVMAEAGSESREGIIAVAQCILNAAEREGVRPTEAVKMYKYTPDRKEPTEAVREAVSAVFDNGETVTDEPIIYFYANYIHSGWHETQRFITQIGVHRFFAAWEGDTK